MSWDIVIGIETHVQLTTQTKIFSGASTSFGMPANENACLVSLAYPGTLPLQTTADGSKREREGRDEGRKRY